MNETDEDGIYSSIGETFDLGNYSVDIRVYDIFDNRVIVEDAVQFTVVEELPTTTTTPPPYDGMLMLTVSAGIAVIGIVLLIVWKVKRG